METNYIKEMEIKKEIPQEHLNVWKELISHGSNKHNKFDERTQMVFDALRQKCEILNSEQDKSAIEIQLEESYSHLEDLKQFGNELANNIKIANEKHELLQSQCKHEKDIELQEKLEKEAELSLRQFDDISKKWPEMNNLKEPMIIYEEMQKQRENISNLMASKDELIEQCQQELMTINNKYYKDLDQQSVDICILVDRVDHQVKLLKKSYRTSIDDLQNAIDLEKQKILHAAQENWNNVYKHISISEDEKMGLIKNKQNFYAQELDNVRNKQEEINRTTKIRLEKDAEILELEIRKTQANILMNSEKIDYNYQILQKRNDENVVINSQQKRRVAKLNESIAVLKKKLAEIRENNNLTLEKLTFDIQKLHASIKDLKAKAKFFRNNNSVKLVRVWQINFKEVKNLVMRVFDIDRILYEQQLGRKWMRPNFKLNKLHYISEFQTHSQKNRFVVKQDRTANSLLTPENQNQLHDILHKISDRAGFLVEEKLLEILKPYTDNDQCLVNIENIFSALNITNITALESLIKYFDPYTWCRNCSLGPQITSSNSLNSFNSPGDDKNNYRKGTNANPADIVCDKHIPCMEPTLVLTALNEFLTEEINTIAKSPRTRKSSNNIDVDWLQFDKDHISSYWKEFSSCISEDQQNVWKQIEHGLNHYLEVLKKRAQIDSECLFLQNQNAELKYLLQKL